MNREPGFDEASQQRLDGERVEAEPDAEAARFAEIVTGYAESLSSPPPSLDAAVMARVRSTRPSPTVRMRLSQPLLRPLPAAAVLILALATGAVLGRKTAPAAFPPAATSTAPHEILVRFELNAPGARSVSLAGSFNDWDGGTVPLIRQAESSIWSAVVPLEPGEHEYLFVIDGERWVADPDAQAQVDDGFGNVNSVVVVGPRGVASS